MSDDKNTPLSRWDPGGPALNKGEQYASEQWRRGLREADRRSQPPPAFEDYVGFGIVAVVFVLVALMFVGAIFSVLSSL